MARLNFKAGTLEAPLPAVMVSVGDMESSNIITVAWTGILSSDPPRTYISVRPSRYSHGILMEKKEFVINLTNEALALYRRNSSKFSKYDYQLHRKVSLCKDEVVKNFLAEQGVTLE